MKRKDRMKDSLLERKVILVKRTTVQGKEN